MTTSRVMTIPTYSNMIVVFKTRAFRHSALFLFVIFITNCEKKTDLVNLTTEAKVIGFVADKCFCCWGWEIEVGSGIIKADSLPGLNSLENVVFPFNAMITIGNKTIDCSKYSTYSGNKHDYYEIKEFAIRK